MKKICGLIIFATIMSLCLSACDTKPQASMVQAQRRFAKYVEPQKNTEGRVIDLSEGPKLRYDANFGPKSPEFDIKITNPY